MLLVCLQIPLLMMSHLSQLEKLSGKDYVGRTLSIRCAPQPKRQSEVPSFQTSRLRRAPIPRSPPIRLPSPSGRRIPTRTAPTRQKSRRPPTVRPIDRLTGRTAQAGLPARLDRRIPRFHAPRSR